MNIFECAYSAKSLADQYMSTFLLDVESEIVLKNLYQFVNGSEEVFRGLNVRITPLDLGDGGRCIVEYCIDSVRETHGMSFCVCDDEVEEYGSGKGSKEHFEKIIKYIDWRHYLRTCKVEHIKTYRSNTNFHRIVTD
ncbi:hypothetical protein ABNQ39_13215 [Azospirillum sp. A26]|uniref:hypothetical protein n=1 Tax=Azospirillum sp. A26 TaxID=3160607 RepID=UPI00366AF775